MTTRLGKWITAGVLAAAALSAAPAAAAPVCPPSRPEVTVTLAMAEPVIDNAQPQPALQKMAGKAPAYGRTQGLYRADLEVGWRARVHRDGACRWIDEVTVTIDIPKRVIYIARERQSGSCAYESVLAHERQHQAADEAVLAEHRPRLKRAAEEAATLPPIVVPEDAGTAADARLTGRVAAALRQGFAQLAQARADRQAAIDTPAEYHRVHALCG
jgi:hypothetical protein